MNFASLPRILDRVWGAKQISSQARENGSNDPNRHVYQPVAGDAVGVYALPSDVLMIDPPEQRRVEVNCYPLSAGNGYSCARREALPAYQLGRCPSVRCECIASLVVLVDLATVAQARTYINCAVREVIIETGPSQGSSSVREKNMTFWLDDTSKTVRFADDALLTVTRFDDNWITAKHGGISFEFDRRRGSLSYAFSSERDRMTTVIVGSGRCDDGSNRR